MINNHLAASKFDSEEHHRRIYVKSMLKRTAFRSEKASALESQSMAKGDIQKRPDNEELAHAVCIAVAHNSFTLDYQPQFETRTHKIRGVEALLRWNHPEYGYISPETFIPIAENLGLIAELGRTALHMACMEATKWKLPVKIAVNLSPVQLQTSDIFSTVVNILNKTGLDPARLELEITEKVVLTNRIQAAQTLNDIRNLGVSVALDDFGTGYSSLSALRDMPIDTIKLDKSFLNGIAEHPEAKALVKLVLDVGTELGKTVIIEGVETEAQHDHLLGVDYKLCQGFLFARPMEASKLSFLY